MVAATANTTTIAAATAATATATATAAATATAVTPATTAARKRCFAPVVDDATRLLILGSLPGERSLALQQYYGNPQNRFWMLMAALLQTDLLALPYEARLAALRRHGVGLWDVVGEARRDGSLDTNIRERDDNDLLGLLADHPAIATIGFNGGTAARLGRKALGTHAARYRIVDLPSSSPAYTLAYADKLAQWRALLAD